MEDDSSAASYSGAATKGFARNYNYSSGSDELWPSYVSAVIYPIILAIVCMVIRSGGQTSTSGFILGLVFAVATGVPIALGGFYLIIIPLPFIFLYKVGCRKTWLPLSKKICYSLLCVLTVGLMFVSLYVL